MRGQTCGTQVPAMDEVVLLARKLDAGGTERQMVTLALGLAARGVKVHVLVFYGGGALEPELISSAVRLHVLGKSGRWDMAGFILRLVSHLRRIRPRVIYSFLDVPNILALMIRPWVGRPRLIWSVRSAGMQMSYYDWLARFVPALEARLSARADCIVANSRAGLQWAVGRGFPAHKLQVIENGIDTEHFRPVAHSDPQARLFRDLPEGRLRIGLVGRLDAMKDHPNFLKAGARLLHLGADVQLVCVGGGPADYRQMLQALADQLGLSGRVSWLGARKDMPSIYAALDLVCLSSMAEGFPNVVGEAMACGVPCVVTDVGDAAHIVGDCGIVVPPGSPDHLAHGLQAMLDRLVREPDLKHKARQRIVSLFSVQNMVDRTQALFGPPA